MVLSPSREANWFAAGQEIPRISRNPKVHYRTHKPSPLIVCNIYLFSTAKMVVRIRLNVTLYYTAFFL